MKICEKCEKECNDSTEICFFCGRDVFKSNGINEENNDLNNSNFNTIGGWLILVGIGRVFAPFMLINSIRQYYDYLFTNKYTQGLALMAAKRNIPSLKPVYLEEFFYCILIFLFHLILIYLFFKKKRKLPMMIIVFLVVSIIYSIVNYVIHYIYHYADGNVGYILIRTFITNFIVNSIWIMYFLKSKRVKGTFVH